MTTVQTIPHLDLNRQPPRSPREIMAGILHLPRMIDKARAYRQGTLGEYIYPCPLDRRVLDFIGADAEAFADRAAAQDDDRISEWALEQTRSRSERERRLFNIRFIANSPQPGESMDYFIEQLDRLNPHRADIGTWVDLIDLEEGRK